MQIHGNATCARQAPAAGLIRTHYALVVCVGCSHERIHAPRHEPSGPEGAASARRSFILCPDLREDR